MATNNALNITDLTPTTANNLSAAAVAGDIYKNLLLCTDSDMAPWVWGVTTTGVDPTTGTDRYEVTDMLWLKSAATTAIFTTTRATDAPTFSQSGLLRTTSFSFNPTTADASIAATDNCYIYTTVSKQSAASLCGSSFTLSFWVRDTITGTHCVQFDWGISSRQWVATYTINAADTWEYKTITVTAPPTNLGGATEAGLGLQIKWVLAAGSNFQTTAGSWQSGTDTLIATSAQVNSLSNTANLFRITLIQLEKGSVASNYQSRLKSIERTLLMPYLEGTEASGFITKWNANQVATTTMNACVQFRATKVATPTVKVSNAVFTAGEMDWISTAGVSTSRATTAININQFACQLQQTAAVAALVSGYIMIDCRLI